MSYPGTKLSAIQRMAYAAVGAVALALTGPASAQNWPAKPITVVAVLAAGSGLDVITRLYSQRLSQSLGRPLVVENKPGGSQIVGIQSVLNAPADGHTLLVATSAGLALNHTMFKTQIGRAHV